MLQIADTTGRQLGSTIQVFDAMKDLAAEANADKRERFWMLALDSQRRCIEPPWLVALGSLRACLVHPREAFRRAVHVGADAVVFLHNHPAGVAQPSDEDKLLTSRLVASGAVLGITVLDHIIIGDTEATAYYSFAENGMLK